MKRNLLLIVLTLLSVSSASKALNVIYVDVNSANDPGTGTFEDPFRRIQDAIDAATDGNIIEIRPGRYIGTGNYNLDPNGLSLTIRSIDPNDPTVIANTIIDPNNMGRGFHFHSGEDANCVVTGLTLRNGATDGSGGGIFCTSSSPTIRNCVIIKNATTMWGGGGIYLLNSQSTISHCIVAGNTAGDTGGGIRCLSGSPSIINCTISGNSAVGEGDGVYCFNSSVAIKNCIIWGNISDQIEAIGGDPVITYSDVQEDWSGVGNIETDPCFVSFDPNSSFELWDFHLQSEYGRWDSDSQSWVYDANTSPCIDTGDPNSDWYPELWPNGKRINMGAYGGTSQASKNGNPADFDVDGLVNFVDFGELAKKWLLEEFCIEDLTISGVIDFADLYLFVENWLWQRE